MPSQKRDAAIRKRQQIAKANRTMFIWVAGASVVVAASVVVLFALGQKLFFNESVLAEKSKTVSTLKKNNQIVDDLKNNVRVLNTNQSLINLQTPADNEPAQVVFDALPSTANSAALGTALQSEKLLGQSGITIESLTVDPVSSESADGSESSSGDESSSENSIQFNFSVSAPSSNANALKNLLKSLEKSIRALNIKTMNVEQQGDKIVLSASGEAYFQPAKSVELQETPVPSKTKASKK